MLLDVQNLGVAFENNGTLYTAVKNISFSINNGEIVGFVGESGAGKSVTAKAILRITGPGSIVTGKVIWQDRINLLELPEKEMRKIRGSGIAMIFQNPQLTLNPGFTIKNQLISVIKLHNQNLSKDQIAEKLENLLELVQAGYLLRNGKINSYPFQLSGGECQRIMIAMALACNPELLIADEPTSSLDVTIQAEILDLLKDIQEKFKLAVLFISHDLAIVSQIANRIMVIYKGEIVESGETEKIFTDPRHPYTVKLINSIPVPKYL